MAEIPKLKFITLLFLSILVISIKKAENFHYPPIYPLTYNRRQGRRLLPNESKKPMEINRQMTIKLIKSMYHF